MNRYMETLQRWETQPLSFIAMQQNQDDANWRSEHAKLKEYFHKLKFNFLEYESKRIFLETLKRPKDEIVATREHTLELELKVEDSQREIKQLKEKLSKQTHDIELLLRDLATNYALFKAEWDALHNQLSDIKKLLDEQATESDPTGVTTVLEQRELTEELRRALIELGGVQLLDSSTRELLQLRLNVQSSGGVRIPEYVLRLSFEARAQQLTDAELVPAAIPFADLCEEAIRISDARFLVRELLCRIENYHALLAELAELGKQNLSQRLDAYTFTIQLPSKALAQLLIGVDYPQPYARITLLKMENAPKPLIEQLKAQINKGPAMSLTAAIQLIHQTTTGAVKQQQQ